MPDAPSVRYAFHPYLPERLGFRAVLRLLNPGAARLLDQTDGYTLAQARARIAFLREAREVLKREVPGDFVEFGVYRGGTAAVAAHVLLNEPERHLHLFDRWGDLPEPTDEDGFRKEQYSPTKINTPDKIAIRQCAFNAARMVVEDIIGFPNNRVHYYHGWFEDTMEDYPGNPIAFASIDCDYYQSVKQVLAFCETYASPRAAFFIDDYSAWPGAKLATDEFLNSTKRTARLSVTPIGRAIVYLMD